MHKRLANYLRIILAALPVILSAYFVIPAKAQGVFSNCLLNASSNQHVSLGKPLAYERLGNKANIKIGILPYYFSDGDKYDLSNEDKRDYYLAAKIIEEVSKNYVKVEIIFLPNIQSNLTSFQFKQILLKTNEGWSERNLEKSTYGFVKNILLANDEFIDYSNLDSVILEGGNRDRSFSHAEAFGFFQSSDGNNFLDSNSEFFKSVKTKEGFIDNAVLLDSHKGPNIIAHELFHNFGLTDLYGSGTGPGQFSMMASNASRILNYERAVLGWFPPQDFKCDDFSKVIDLNSAFNLIEIKDIYADSIFLLKKAEDTAYIIEVSQLDSKPHLFVYLLEQNLRPPITMYGNPNKTYLSMFDLSDPNNVGSFYKAFEFSLLISNQNGKSLTLKAIPNAMASSAEAKKVFEESILNREVILKKVAADADAKAKADADAKAKADADAKAKADADAKAKAEVNTLKLKKTITCIKGNSVKKIKGLNPKCPEGYKKK
jgi:hypothetical protein